MPFIGIIFIASVAISVSSFMLSKKALDESIQQQISAIETTTVREIDEWIASRQLDIEHWATRLDYADFVLQKGTNPVSQAQIRTEFDDITKRYAHLDAIHIFNSSGLALASSNPKAIGVMNIADRPYFQKAIKGQPAISDVVISKDRGTPIIVLAAPLKKNNEVVGVLVCGLALDKVCGKFVIPTRVCRSGYLFICDEQGRYIGHPDATKIFKDKLADSEWGQQMMKQKRGALTYKLNGVNQWITFDSCPSLRWFVAVTVPVAEMNTHITAMGRNNFVLVSIALICGLVVAIWLARSISKPINLFVDSLFESAGQLDNAAGQIARASHSLAEGASEQASSLEETSASLEEMTSMTHQNAENAQTAKDFANQTRQAADTGGADMQKMNAAMETIKTASSEISKIIKTIDEIAFQTNILALNAAVEAARAGEAGMGFAVVAEEVRNLAQRSAQAARETADKIQGAINKTQQGVDISAKVSVSLSEILAKVHKVDELIADVATASKEQSQGVQQINTAISQMDRVTQSNAANAEECSSAAEELKAQSVALKKTVLGLNSLIGHSSERTAVANNQSNPEADH